MGRPFRQVPSFSLYGEEAIARSPVGPLHIEDIPSRSRKYLWTIAAHRHVSLSQCIFVSSGPVQLRLDDMEQHLSGPTVIVVPSGAVHSFRFTGETRGFVLTLDLDRLLNLADPVQRETIATVFALPRALDLRSDSAFAARIHGFLETALREFKQPDSMAAPVSGWLACSLLWVIAQATAGVLPLGLSRHDSAAIRRFRQLIEVHYAARWSVSHYAKRLALSESSLNRLCRRLCGETAFQMIQRRLALEARRRLVYVATTVAAVGTQLGFKDPAYFARFFRKHCGESPAAFRRANAGG